MSVERDGRRTSAELTEIRTVLSRAETVVWRLDRLGQNGYADPAYVEARPALVALIRALKPYERTTGRPRRR